MNRVESIDYHGNNRTLISHQSGNHYFGVTFLSPYLFVSEWTLKGVFKLNASSGAVIGSVYFSGIDKLMALVPYDSSSQRAVNTCPALPAPSNGTRLGCPGNATMYYDTVCQFSCNNGYIGSGSQKRRCQHNGTWSGQEFTCQIINCTSLMVNPGGPLRMSSCDNHYGSKCNFSCTIGYRLNGSSTVTCVAPGNQHPGVWNNTIPTCEVITCPALPAPSNGTKLGCPENATMYFNTTCQFSCNNAYIGSGSQIRRCQHNGTWSGQNFTCQIINCTSLTVDPSGPLRMSSCSNHYGSKCNFSCTIGHRLNGSSSVTCVAPGNQHPGVWNNTIPTCEAITCPALPASSNGTRLGCPGNATMYYNTTCQFSCNNGYIGSGSQARRCQHNGTWSGKDFTCQIINCTSLKVDPGGPLRMSSCDNHYGSKCNFSCTIGNRLNGSSTVTCVAPGNQHLGIWNNTIPTCEVITCPALPAPSKGTRLGCPGNATMYYNTTCQFSCNNGYIGSGSQARRCQHNGTWSGQDFTCQIINCTSLTVDPAGPLRISSCDNQYGAKCNFSCTIGYRLNGSSAVTCVAPGNQNSGVWNNTVPTCRAITCPTLPAPSNGTRLGCPGNATMYYNTSCQFSCNNDYIGSGSQVRRCQHNGTWSGQDFTCQIINCTSLTVDPSSPLRMSSCDNHYGAECNFSCAIGYRLNGSSSVTCVATGNQQPGVWNNTIPTCEVITCQKFPAPSNGTRLGCSGNATMYYDTVCQFSCNNGYIGSGSQVRRCQHNGTWSGQNFTCQIVTCPALPSPSDSVRHGCTGNATKYPYSTVCRFSCIEGYKVSGSSVRRCQENGQWSGGEFSCERVLCEPLQLAPNIRMKAACTRLPGDACEFACKRGYDLIGSDIRRCNSNGSWTGTQPRCEAVTCPTLSPPTNGELLECNTTEMLYDTVCRFSCKEGSEASGSTVRRCTENGTWSGNDLVCTVCQLNFMYLVMKSNLIQFVVCGRSFQLDDLEKSPEFHTSVRETRRHFLRSPSLTLFLPIELPVYRRYTVPSTTVGRRGSPYIIFSFLGFFFPRDSIPTDVMSSARKGPPLESAVLTLL
ncbi:hypothetical protein ACROYT_G034006 [Oculina patagonica]